MSGPKVVRIVTREEVQETCRALLRQLDAGLAAWNKEMKRLGITDAGAISAAKLRRNEIAAAFDVDAFMDIQKKVPSELAFLANDISLRRDQLAEAAALAAQRGRQQRENAKSLMDELSRRGIALDERLARDLEGIGRGTQPSAEAEAILLKGFALLTSPTKDEKLTGEQQQLANALMPTAAAESYEDWKNAHAQASNSRLKRVEMTLAELEISFHEDAAVEFKRRLTGIETKAELPDFDMLVDSLIFDISTALTKARVDASTLDKAHQMVARIPESVRDDTLRESRDALSQAIQKKDYEKLSLLCVIGEAELTRYLAQVAADARRAAVLDGLAALGYEVREGMASAWASKGNVVLRNPSLPGYGVEVASPSDATRMQVRPVALGSGHDKRRDRDVETLWCGDFSKLQTLIASQGGGLKIERELAIGATPLKAVVLDSSENSSAADTVTTRVHSTFR